MNIRNRNKFRISRFILLKVPYLFTFLGWLRKPAKRLLIIKIDAIGDYILFRNFIELVYSSDKFKGYEIDMIGNELWRDIALEYDNKYLARTFFVKPDELYNNPLLTLKTGWKLYKRNYEQVLQPTYSRTLLANGLAALSSAKHSVAFESDNQPEPRYKKQTDKFYTNLLALPPKIFHEFERNRFFFEQVTELTLQLAQATLPVISNKTGTILIFPGSGIAKRNWEKEKFLEVINRILISTPFAIVICGSEKEKILADYLMQNIRSTRVTDRTGQTTLPALITEIAAAQMIISNETSAVHIASACNTPAICVQGGGHFKRFTPYPVNYQTSTICLFEPMPCFNCNWNCTFLSEPHEPYPCLTRVAIEPVWREIAALLHITIPGQPEQ